MSKWFKPATAVVATGLALLPSLRRTTTSTTTLGGKPSEGRGRNRAGFVPQAQAQPQPPRPVIPPGNPDLPMFFPRDVAAGDGCLNPASEAVRAAFRTPIGPGMMVDTQALANDIDFLAAFLRQNYAGYAELAQNQGFDPATFFAQWKRDVLAAGPTISFERGLDQPALTLKLHMRDKHFDLAGVRWRHSDQLDYSEYQASVPAGAASGQCAVTGSADAVPATLRRSSVLNVADGSFFPILTLSARAAGDTVTVECNTTKVPLSRRAGSQVTANRRLPSYEYRPVGDVGWITLRRFAGNDADLTLLGKLKDDYPRHSQHPVLVFDMRGNPGGNDSYVHRWVLQATNRTYFGGSGMTLVGPYTGCIQWNNMVIDQVAAGRADSDQAKADRQQTTKSWPEKVAPTHVQTKEYVFTGESKASYTGKVVILLDAMSFSSAETAADELVRALGAKVVGER